MPITNPTAIRWSNEKIRTFASKLHAVHVAAQEIQTDYFAVEVAPGETLASHVSANAGQVFDGAENDGRPVIENDDIINMVTRAQEVLQYIEGTGQPAQVDRRATIAKVVPGS